MRRTLLLVLSVVVTGAALSGCQSDAQKMDKGLAKEYQERYQHCIVSIERFKKYAGFDFVEERGVCKCNGVECNGDDVCSPTAACKEMKIEPECTDNSKICISQTIGQVCKDGHWGAPVNCKDSGEVCNAEVQGASVCAPACSNNFCTQDKDGVGSMYECKDGQYKEGETCKDRDNVDVSCTFNFDNNTSACGECRNGDVQCVDDNRARFCENGQWSDEIPNKSYLDCSISCEISDGPDKCYNTRTCFKEMDSGRSHVAILTESGELKEVETCINTCENGACVIEPEPSVECPESCTYGCEGTTDKCKEDPEPTVECPATCPPGEACNADTGYTCKCTDDYYKCEEGKIYKCDDGSWSDKEYSCKNGCKDDVLPAPFDTDTPGALLPYFCKPNPSVEEKTCNNNFRCNDYMVKCQSGDDFIDINDASNVSVLKNELENLGCAYDSANNRIYCGKQSGDTIDNTDGCCDAEQTYCFDGKAYDCKSKRLEHTNCDDKCAGKNDGETVSCDASCPAQCPDGEECSESTGYECKCITGYFKCEDGYIWSCNIDHEWIKGKLDCANGCKAGVGPKSANSIGNVNTDDLIEMFCADGSDEVCDSSVYYVCQDNGRVGKCLSESSCSDVDDADMLMINTDNSISLCSGGNWSAKCDVFPDGLENELIKLQNRVCTDVVGFSICFKGCACEQFANFSDGNYYVNLSNAHNYQAMTQFFVIWEEDEDGEQGTCELCINTEY